MDTKNSDAALSGTAKLELDLYGTQYQLDWPRDVVLLDLLMDHGIEAAYSCREGTCGTCVCSLNRGAVRMRNNRVLGPKDLADGYILACQCLPEADDCRVTF